MRGIQRNNAWSGWLVMIAAALVLPGCFRPSLLESGRAITADMGPDKVVATLGAPAWRGGSGVEIWLYEQGNGASLAVGWWFSEPRVLSYVLYTDSEGVQKELLTVAPPRRIESREPKRGKATKHSENPKN